VALIAEPVISTADTYHGIRTGRGNGSSFISFPDHAAPASFMVTADGGHPNYAIENQALKKPPAASLKFVVLAFSTHPRLL
jgi:hypothetical protein